MIIDTGGLLIVLLVLIVPVAAYKVMRRGRSRESDLLEQIRSRQQELGSPDPLAEINAARTPADLDAAARRAQLSSEIVTLISQLPPNLRDRVRRGA